MGIFSRNPFLAVRINSGKCFSCGKCEKKCPAGCIDPENKTIETERCVSCMNCISSCPAGAIKYETKPKEQDFSRRKFLMEAGVMAAAMGVTLAPKIAAAPIENMAQNTPFIPPGAVNLSRFDGTCTACHLCVGVCPAKILKPAGIEYGFMRMFKPYMDYKQGFCQFECKKCSEVCPVRAITPMTIEKKKATKLGNVILDKFRCVVYKENKNCGACSEHCPTKAVFMEEVSGGIYGPETDNSICIGCGACQHVCPVTPKAIYLEPLAVHKQAAVRNITKDKEVEEREKAAQSEEFPF
jgi:ferredoxin